MDDLKYQGLLERVARLTARYEDEIADLRVEVTNLSNQVDKLTQEKKDLEEELEGVLRVQKEG